MVVWSRYFIKNPYFNTILDSKLFANSVLASVLIESRLPKRAIHLVQMLEHTVFALLSGMGTVTTKQNGQIQQVCIYFYCQIKVLDQPDQCTTFDLQRAHSSRAVQYPLDKLPLCASNLYNHIQTYLLLFSRQASRIVVLPRLQFIGHPNGQVPVS